MSESILSRRDFLRLSGVAALGAAATACASLTAIEKAKSWGMGDLAENAMRANVSLVMQSLKKSPILSAAEESGRLKIVGARYDLDSETVDVLFS